MAEKHNNKKKKKGEERGKGHHGGDQSDKEVDIALCLADPPDVYLNYNNGHGNRAFWKSTDGATYAIVFQLGPVAGGEVSPFKDTVFVVKADGTPTPSGPIKHAPASKDDRYRYRIIGDNGCDIDPIIHIGP